jgi:hypothetical protein
MARREHTLIEDRVTIIKSPLPIPPRKWLRDIVHTGARHVALLEVVLHLCARTDRNLRQGTLLAAQLKK